MNNFILNGSLAPRHKEAGIMLCLAPADKSLLNLIQGGHVIKSFDADKTTIYEILEEADKWLYNKN